MPRLWILSSLSSSSSSSLSLSSSTPGCQWRRIIIALGMFCILFQGVGGDEALLNTNKGGGKSQSTSLSSLLSPHAASSSSTQTKKQQQHQQTLIAAADPAPSQQQQQQQQQLPIHHHPLLHDPHAALKPFLSATHNMASSSSNNNNDYISQFTLTPTVLGRDNYRPTLEKNTRIVAFGDVHGNIHALQTFLISSRVLYLTSTNHKPQWSGGQTICVQTGDVLDRRDTELACYRLLATLARQAARAGGRCYSCTAIMRV